MLIGAVFLCTNAALSQCACCAGASIGSSNGDYNNGVFTLPKNKFVLEGYGDYRTFMDEGGHHETVAPAVPEAEPEAEETPLKSMLISSIGAKYGITDKITVSALLPYVFLTTSLGNDQALGDLILLGTFGLYSKREVNVALSAGIELPTGQQKGSSFDNTTIVVGSGSFDPMLGLSVSKRWNKALLQFNTIGKYTTSGFDKTNFGSLSIQNLALAYQLKGPDAACTDSLTKNKEFRWTVSGGYYGEWLGAINTDGDVDPNSGYYLGFGTLGTAVSFKGFSIPLTFSMPFIQHLNGSQSNAGYRVRLGIVKMF